ncbi:hypothetical protein GCM10010191_14750 [Actinomadura vinacea]|uniref:GNAT family N-acetyltransferase n=1 Tax=Actinomadura vinacea TaxID=115336 RepID=A0ABN3IKL7_9ACTN
MPGFDEPAELVRRASFGPLDSLHGAFRRRFPQVVVARLGAPTEFLVVTYRHRGPWRVLWDDGDELFIWASGPQEGKPVGTLTYVERTAERVARPLGVPTHALRC